MCSTIVKGVYFNYLHFNVYCHYEQFSGGIKWQEFVKKGEKISSWLILNGGIHTTVYVIKGHALVVFGYIVEGKRGLFD